MIYRFTFQSGLLLCGNEPQGLSACRVSSRGRIPKVLEADNDLSVEVAKKFYRIVLAESEIVGHESIA